MLGLEGYFVNSLKLLLIFRDSVLSAYVIVFACYFVTTIFGEKSENAFLLSKQFAFEGLHLEL